MAEILGLARGQLRLVDAVAPHAQMGLSRAEKSILKSIQVLCEQKPLEAARLAVVAATGEVRVRRRVNQTHDYAPIDGQEALTSLGAGAREILGRLSKCGLLTEHRVRPFLDGRMVEHILYELTEHGRAVVKTIRV